MKRLTLLVALVTGCVPTTESADPRGAAGARFVPDGVAQGAPFTTSDGWTVTFERIALVAQVSAQAPTDGSGGYVVWDGAQKAETWVPALPVGPCTVNVHLEGVFLGSLQSTGLARSGVLAASAIAPDIASLVFTVPDNASASLAISTAYGQVQQGPAIVFSAHAEKDGRTWRTSLALAAAFTIIGDRSQDVVLSIPKDDVLFAEYEVRPERIFAAGRNDPTTVFAPLAEADRLGNDDGVVGADELRSISLLAAGVGASGCEDATGLLALDCATLLDRVADNAQHVVVAVGTSR